MHYCIYLAIHMLFLPLYCAVKAGDAVLRDRADLESSGGGEWHEDSIPAVCCGPEEATGSAGIEDRQVQLSEQQ